MAKLLENLCESKYILVAGELEAETLASSERDRKQMVVGDEQENGRYLGLQTSSVVNIAKCLE